MYMFTITLRLWPVYKTLLFHYFKFENFQVYFSSLNSNKDIFATLKIRYQGMIYLFQ